MYDHDVFFTDADRSQVHIVNNIFYRHTRIRVNYTTYHRRRDYDVLSANHAKGRVESPSDLNNIVDSEQFMLRTVDIEEASYEGNIRSTRVFKHFRFLSAMYYPS